MTADLDRQRVETAATEAQAREAAKQREQEQQRADAEKRRADQEAQRAAEIARQQADAERARVETLLPLTSASECDGTLSNPLAVGLSPTLLLAPGIDCQLIWTVITGKVRLEGASGYADFGPEGLLVKTYGPNWRAMTIRALEPGTQIVLRFCPQGTSDWHNGKCV
jgi:uncharacterized membrane protein YdbT with pleckstrin-like domain